MNRWFIPYCVSADADYIPADELKEVITDASKPTRLFLFLEQRDWNEALACLQKSPHQVTVWVRRQPSSSVVIWKMLPLHAAVAFGAPLHLIEKLVTIHPTALRKPDHDGKLPLHYAAIFSNRDQKDVMSYMLKKYPESIWNKDACGRTAIEFSCNNELLTSERIRMRTKLSSNTDIENHDGSLDNSSLIIDIDGKENDHNTKNITIRTDAHGVIATVNNVNEDGPKTSTRTSIHRSLIKTKMPFQIKTKRSRELHAFDINSNIDESNEADQDEGLSCHHVEEVDHHSGRRTIYLNFALTNEDEDDNYESSASVPSNIKENVTIARTSGKSPAAAAKHIPSKNKSMKGK
jgi:hypothetical protein